MIKSVNVNPVVIDGTASYAIVSVYVDSAELAAAYVKAGLDPADITVNVEDGTMTLKEAADSKIAAFNDSPVYFVTGG